jgi:hypothetical protein
MALAPLAVLRIASGGFRADDNSTPLAVEPAEEITGLNLAQTTSGGGNRLLLMVFELKYFLKRGPAQIPMIISVHTAKCLATK